MSPTRRMFALVVAVAVLTAIALRLPLGELPEVVARLGPLAPVVGVVVGAGLLVAMIPRTPVSLACGLLFGAALGAACALLVALVAATVTFAAGRWLGRDFVTRHLGVGDKDGGAKDGGDKDGGDKDGGAGPRSRAARRWFRLEAWVTCEGVLAVAAVRALPIGPYGLAGYVYGTSGIRTRDYALGTLIAAAPSAVSYALLGAAVAGPGTLSPVALLPLASGLALSAAVVVRARVVARRQARDDPGRRAVSWPGAGRRVGPDGSGTVNDRRVTAAPRHRTARPRCGGPSPG